MQSTAVRFAGVAVLAALVSFSCTGSDDGDAKAIPRQDRPSESDAPIEHPSPRAEPHLEASPTEDLDDSSAIVIRGAGLAPDAWVYLRLCGLDENGTSLGCLALEQVEPSADGTFAIDDTIHREFPAEVTVAGQHLQLPRNVDCAKVRCVIDVEVSSVFPCQEDGGTCEPPAPITVSFHDGDLRARPVLELTASPDGSAHLRGNGFLPGAQVQPVICSNSTTLCEDLLPGGITVTADSNGEVKAEVTPERLHSGSCSDDCLLAAYVLLNGVQRDDRPPPLNVEPTRLML